jgi:hypothetical protein
MKLNSFFLLNIAVFLSFLVKAQVIDDFSDDDFTNNPTWSGTTADFIVNSSQQLQLSSQVAGASYLTTPHGLTSLDNKEWRIWVKYTFSPSSSNYGRVFLTSTISDFSQGNDFGYFLQFGESGLNDAIKLYRSENSLETLICSGPIGQIANSFQVSLKIKRNSTGDWSIYGDFTGGQNYSLIANGNDPTNYIGGYFGISAVYTISNANKFYYDNIYIGNEILDLTPPVLTSANVISSNQVDALFNEAVTALSAENSGNYSISSGISIASSTLDAINPSLVHLNLANNLVNGNSYTLTTNNISDIAGNASGIQSINFQYLVADSVTKGDVLITEFFPDPSPVVGLPEVEFVEIYNASNKIFNLSGWKIGDASADGTISSAWLLPGEYKVLTANANDSLFTMTDAMGVTSFPSLNNTGDDVVLKDSFGNILDKLTYTDDWYQDDVKKSGGYTLELINPNDPCSDASNWIASVANEGGTPGLQNSVFDISPDVTEPQATLWLALSPNYLEVHFSEGMDSTSLANAIFNFSPALTIQNRFIQGSYPNKLILQFNEMLVPSIVYNVNLNGIGDCWLNYSNVNGQFALPDIPSKGDVVINEILQNPLNGGQDWIELYNYSDKIFNLKDWQFANFDNDTIDNYKTIQVNYFLFPKDYVVIGKDSSFVKANYPAAVSGKFLYAELPSYNNDSGSVYLIYNSEIIDKVSYQDEWHFDLLDNTDGVSLERIDPRGESSSSFNWHSAAEDIGFATPGAVNSQFLSAVSNGTVTLTNDVFSPDNDGFEDVLQISYEMNESGLLGKATIFDDRGRPIRKLFSNELLGSKGTFTWDGVADNQVKASIGIYVVLFEAFSTDGGVIFATKKAVTLAGRL